MERRAGHRDRPGVPSLCGGGRCWCGLSRHRSRSYFHWKPAAVAEYIMGVVTSVRSIVLAPFRALASAVLALFACLRAAWIVLRLVLAVALLSWLAIGVWLAWHYGQFAHLIAALVVFAIVGSLSRGGSCTSRVPRIWIWYQPPVWHRCGVRANLREDD